jgi:hypothetical protein
MKASAVYRRAAEWMDRQPEDRHIMAYACLMSEPDNVHEERCAHLKEWLGSEYIDAGIWSAHEARVLALLLMAEIARDEE